MPVLKWAAVAALAVFAASCGGGGDESRERQMENELKKRGIDADVELNNEGGAETVEITRGDQRVGNDLALPADFPDDVAVSDDWAVIHTGPAPQGGYMLQATAPKDRDGLLAMLRKEMTGDGWTEAGFAEPAPQMTQIGFEKDGRMANYNLIDNGETFMVQLVTMVKP